MERASRLIVIASIVLAGATHAWLATWHPWLPAAAAAVFAITFVLARVSLPLTLAPVVGAIYLMPAIYYIAMGRSSLSTDFQLTLVWLAAVAGPLVAHSDLARWHLPPRWTLPLVGWALVLAVSWPIVAGREIDFSLIAARTLDTTNALSGVPPRMAAAWVVIIALAQMLGILWIDLLWARFSGAELARAERYVILPVIAGTAIGAAVGLYQALVDLDWMNPGIWSNLRRASGLMLDANTFGIGAAIWAPAAIALAWRLGRPVWIGVLFFALLAGGMWTAGSRTALLACSTGTFGVVVAVAQRKGLWQPRVAQIVALVGAGVLVLAMFVAPRGGNSPSPLQRVFDRLPRPEAAELRRFADEMFDRFGYGRAAFMIIADHPLTGTGIGAFHVVLNDYYRRATGQMLRPDNAQNWWRHQLAELGAVGGFPSLWMSLIIVVLVWNGGPYTEPFGATTILRLVIAGIGFASLLGVPTQNPATWFSLATLLFWLAAIYSSVPEGAASAPPRPTISRATWVAAFAIALVLAIGQAVSARGDVRVPVRARENGVPYKYGFAPTEGFSQYGFLRWAAAHAVEVTAVEHPWLQLAIYPAESQDVSTNPISVRVWMNQRRIIEHTLATREPIVHVLQMPPDAKWIMLELTASGSSDDTQAVRVAHEWLPDVPRSAPPDRVIRWVH